MAPPAWAHQAWAALLHALPQDEGWDVWEDWHEARLNGYPTSEPVELIYAGVPEAKWREGPAAANAWIKARLSELRGQARETPREAEVPPQRPAALEPVIRDGEITLPDASAEAELRGDDLLGAMQALRGQIEELARDLESETNIDRRAAGYLRRFEDKIPLSAPNQAELFALAHEQEALEGYAETVSAEWPSLLAKRYLAMTRAFDRTVRQFPKWRAFKLNADNDRLTDAQRAAAPKLTTDFVAALEIEAEGFVVPEIAATLKEMMSQSLDAVRDEMSQDRTPAGAGTLAKDAVTSIENVVKTMAEAALHGAGDATKGYAEEFGKGAVEQAKKEGKKDGAALVKWAKRTLVAAGTLGAAKATGLSSVIAQMMEHYPQIAEWLRPVINFLAHG